MKTVLYAIEVDPSIPVANEQVQIDRPLRRDEIDKWTRLCRYTTDDEGRRVKSELAVFSIVNGQIEYEWREFESGKAYLPDVAQDKQYLLWGKR